MLKDFTEVANRVAATTKKLEKERLVADYLKSLDDPSLERAVIFFCGTPFPRKDERVTGVGWASIADAASQVTGADFGELADAAVGEGDLGDGAAAFFPERASTLTVLQLGEYFDRLAATSGASAKIEILTELLAKADREEARFIIKILLGETRIGLQEGLVESAIARAFAQPLEEVRKAHMFNGDLGTTALLARGGALDEAVMTLFHPLGFMLAQPEETAEDLFAQLGDGAIADDKYDGIRAQLHHAEGKVKIYSRTLDEITERFPEIRDAAESLPSGLILDGEIVAFDQHILPFAILQKRIGRRQLGPKVLASSPVVFFAFDILLYDSAPVFERPLRERLALLDSIVSAEGTIRRGYSEIVHSAEEIDAAFDKARARANEGLVLKDPDSIYTPGRRGKAWLKYKKALATLDCVVTAAQYGNGRRRKTLSDYTFAVRRDDELVNIGKAYSGVTDAEIEQLTAKFKEITIAQHGPVHIVKPEIVFEVAFDRIQESSRHKSGYALRFPRIANVRWDKSVNEISTIDEVRRIYEGQLAREKPE